MEGREYLIRSKFDEERVLKKQAKIARRTGKKPNVVISLRNDQKGVSVVKLEIESIVEDWKAEKDGFESFKAFCEWYNIDFLNLAQYFEKYI